MARRPSPPKAPRDLVTSRLTVKSPSGTLTGGLAEASFTGKNTAWADGQDRDVPRYQRRVDYLKANSTHPLVSKIAGRHLQSSPAEDKRGLSCAEGDSVIQAHQSLKSAGFAHAQSQFKSFQAAVTTPAKGAPLPAIQGPGTAPKSYAAAAGLRPAIQPTEQEVAQQQKELASLLQFTGHSSWKEYAEHEASFLAWNDIERHGAAFGARHDEHSPVSPGKAMEPCPKCRVDIVPHLKGKPSP